MNLYDNNSHQNSTSTAKEPRLSSVHINTINSIAKLEQLMQETSNKEDTETVVFSPRLASVNESKDFQFEQSISDAPVMRALPV
jgi:hypothetical protein